MLERLLTLLRRSRAEAGPVLIWTMGKVSSTSVAATLRHEGIPAAQIHYLVPGNIEAVARVVGKDAKHLRDSMALDLGKMRRPWPVVTMVRDPMARSASAFFENIDRLVPDWRDRDAGDLVGIFSGMDSLHAVPITWLDREIKKLTGIDLSVGFDKARRYGRVRNHIADILVMRVDLDDTQKIREISRLLKRPLGEMKRANEAVGKQYAAVYDAFRKSPFPRKLIDYHYDNDFVRAFWTDEEISAMRAAWTIAD